jgi:hypothetical protein
MEIVLINSHKVIKCWMDDYKITIIYLLALNRKVNPENTKTVNP